MDTPSTAHLVFWGRTRRLSFTTSGDTAAVAGLLAFTGFVAWLSFFTAIHFEEGRDANAYLMAMQGKVPFRDFDWLYGVLAFFIYPPIFYLLGDSLIVLRLSYVVLIGTVALLSYGTARFLLKPSLACMVAIVSVCFLQIPYYTYNHILFVVFLMASIFLLFYFIHSSKWLPLFLAGVCVGLAILSKPVTLGAALFAGASFFLFTSAGGKRITNFVILSLGASIPLVGFLIYFFSKTVWVGREATYLPFFSGTSITQIEQKSHLGIGTLAHICWDRVKDVLILPNLLEKGFHGINPSKILVGQYNSLVLLLLPGIPLVYFLIRQKKFRNELESRYLDLLAVVGLFVSFETIPITHGMNRAFSAQLPLILGFILLARRAAAAQNQKKDWLVAVLFIYIIGIPMLYYPFGKAKKYQFPLVLERLNGIRVTAGEKKFYEGFERFLRPYNQLGDRMGVIGYHPNLAYFTGSKNIFENNEYIFLKLDHLRRNRTTENAGWTDRLIGGFEADIAASLVTQSPRLIVIVGNDARYIDDLKYLRKVQALVDEGYVLKAEFGDADIYGIGLDSVRVKVYLKKVTRS